MALRAHEVLAVAGSVVSPATTKAQIRDYGAVTVTATTTQSVRFTIDGITDPNVGAGTEVGHLLTSGDSTELSPEEFLNSKWLDVSTDARVQFSFDGAGRTRA